LEEIEARIKGSEAGNFFKHLNLSMLISFMLIKKEYSVKKQT